MGICGNSSCQSIHEWGKVLVIESNLIMKSLDSRAHHYDHIMFYYFSRASPSSILCCCSLLSWNVTLLSTSYVHRQNFRSNTIICAIKVNLNWKGSLMTGQKIKDLVVVHFYLGFDCQSKTAQHPKISQFQTSRKETLPPAIQHKKTTPTLATHHKKTTPPATKKHLQPNKNLQTRRRALNSLTFGLKRVCQAREIRWSRSSFAWGSQVLGQRRSEFTEVAGERSTTCNCLGCFQMSRVLLGFESFDLGGFSSYLW